jgi:hypothetical protein
MIELLFILIAGHFVCDYVFQSNEIALGKNQTIDPARHGVPWYYWMFAHAVTHGVWVYLFTHSVLFGIWETGLHFYIDVAKCKKHINVHVDQAMHLSFKVFIVFLMTISPYF